MSTYKHIFPHASYISVLVFTSSNILSILNLLDILLYISIILSHSLFFVHSSYNFSYALSLATPLLEPLDIETPLIEIGLIVNADLIFFVTSSYFFISFVDLFFLNLAIRYFNEFINCV